MHEVVETSRALHEVVETTHDAEDTEGEDPDTDNSDDGGVRADEPSEDTEEGGQDIDDENSAGQLPRGDGGPEGTVGTGDENQPVLSEGNLKEDDLIDVTEVLDDTTILTTNVHSGESDPGTDSEDDTEENGHTPQLGKVPLDGSLGEGGVVVSDGKGGDIGENGDEDDKLNVEGAVENGDPQTEENLHVQGQGDTVDDVSVHAVENLARSLQGINDGAKTRGKENDIGGRAGSVRGTLDGNTSISLLERGSIVDTITSHGNKVTTVLENLDDGVLVLGENLGETISSLDEVVDLRTGHVTATTETKTLRVVDVGTETELARSLTGNTDGITSQHLDGKTKALGLVDSAVGIVTGRVRARHDTENLPRATITLAGNTERTETTGGELSDLVLVVLVNVLGDGVILADSVQDSHRGTLDADNALTLGRLDDNLDLLGDGVERLEVDDEVLGEDILGSRVVTESLEEGLVDGVDTLLLAGSSQAGSEHQVIGGDALDAVRLRKRELVLGEGTGLVRAENLDTSKRLDSTKLLDNGLLLGEVSGTDSHGGGNDSGKTDGDTDNGNGEGESEDLDNAVGAVEAGNPDDEEGEDDQDQENGTNAVEDLSEVTSATSGLGDKGSGATNESVVTSGGNNDEGLTTLDERRLEALIVLVLVDSEGLASDGRLINLQESILSDDLAVSRNDGTLLELEDITGNDLGSSDFLEGTVTEDDGLESESLLQFVDDGASLEFLDETNTGVEKQKTANDTEIDPILETSSEDGSSLDGRMLALKIIEFVSAENGKAALRHGQRNKTKHRLHKITDGQSCPCTGSPSRFVAYVH